MGDISKLNVGGTLYDIKDAKARTDVSDLKEDITDLDNGHLSSPIDLEWEVGSINNSGVINPSDTAWFHTKKLYSSEINGGVIYSNPAYDLYVYRYKADGSAVWGYLTIGKVSVFNVPSDYLNDGYSMRLVMASVGYSVVTAKGYSVTNIQTQLNALNKKTSEEPQVIMIDKIAKIAGIDFDIHYDNIIANFNSKDIPYKELFGGVSSVGMENLARLTGATAGTETGAIAYSKNMYGAYNYPALPTQVYKKPFTVDVVSSSAGNGLNRKVILIGDSWTANGKYANELRNLFALDTEPMNITLLGTLGMGGAYVGPENGFHEGRGAFSSKTYCTKETYNTYANAFFNPSSQTFDFSYYMTNCGYTGVDDVFINLGINDIAEMESFDEILSYYNIIVTSIRSYNSNIRIFIGLCGLPGQYEYSVGNNNCKREKARRLQLHQTLLTEYYGRESEGFFVVPYHLNIDSEHDFPTVQRARSNRDSTLINYCSDLVHPTDIAYNKVADCIRAYIKYAETI